jgi:hypothetical protein
VSSSLFFKRVGRKRCVEVRSLDNIFSSQEPKPTCIKADVEGFELEVLKGADSLIKEYRPNLIFSIYHKREDLYKILLYIHRLDLDYIFHIRQQSSTYGETILYAISK